MVKSFLRIEYVNKEPSAVSILGPHLIHQLRKKEISYDESIFGHLSDIFSGKCRTSVLKTFLSIDSTLTDIPKGRNGRKAVGAVYQRCTEIQAGALSENTLKILVEG